MPGTGCSAPTTGKSGDIVRPPTYAFPEPSTAMARPSSLLLPPRYVEYTTSLPSAVSRATNADVLVIPSGTPCTALTVGKSGDPVVPVTQAWPVAVTAMLL